MGESFYVAAKYNVQQYTDMASKGDTKKYTFDFTAWQEDNDTITGVVWTLESGQATLGTQALAAGVASTLVTLNEAGRVLVSGVASTASGITKKIWLVIRCYDQNIAADDYWGYYTH